MHQYLTDNMQNIDLKTLMDMYCEILIEAKSLKIKLAEFNNTEENLEEIKKYSNLF